MLFFVKNLLTIDESESSMRSIFEAPKGGKEVIKNGYKSPNMGFLGKFLACFTKAGALCESGFYVNK